METFKLPLDIRTQDLNGNNIPIKKTQGEILKAISNVWNVCGVGKFETEKEILGLKDKLRKCNKQIKNLEALLVDYLNCPKY